MKGGCIRWIKSLWLLRVAPGGLVVLLIFGICNGQNADFPEALRQQMHLTTEELRAVQRGDSVVKTLPAKDRREIGVYGIVRLQADVATSFKAFKESMAQQKSDVWPVDLHGGILPPYMGQHAPHRDRPVYGPVPGQYRPGGVQKQVARGNAPHTCLAFNSAESPRGCESRRGRSRWMANGLNSAAL